ncbi:MAG: RNA methyltransferase [Treponema sp.]|nr:RNA methyltransferase [Treponema sp.]
MRNTLTGELAVCGLNAVAALGEHHPERIKRLFLRADRLKQLSGLCKTLADRKKPSKLCDDEELERICKSHHHQGAAAMIDEPVIEPLSREDLDRWSGEGKTGLILVSVGNDHNLGAIVRSAAFFGVSYVALSGEGESARLTTSAYRVAEGGMEHVEFRSLANPAAFLRSAAKSLVVIGAEHRARLRIRDLKTILAGRPPGVALVVGNEETGLPPAIKERCAALVRIPGTGVMESLNVAQAATLFLHELYEL